MAKQAKGEKATNALTRDELFRKIYKIATDLVHTGVVSEWDFKSYVLGMMFYRYISENLTDYVNTIQREAGVEGFDYARIPDEMAERERAELVRTKGFFIPPSELFCNMVTKARRDPNLNMTMERIFRNITESAASGDARDDFEGLFKDFDVNSDSIGATVAERNGVIVELLEGVESMPLFDTDGVKADLFGDAYEYLMSMYAQHAGKKGGQYFTPACISELLTRLGTIGKTRVSKVYDPACGSGSLLLRAAKVLGPQNITEGFYGQEIDLTTYNLCRINMFLHNIGFEKFSIVRGDTLAAPNPMHQAKEPFELIVSNPPFSVPWAGKKDATLINDARFAPAGVLAPSAKGDLAFVMHCLSWLATNGTAAIVCFPGIMYRTGAERIIRKYLVDNNYIDAVIQLPPKLFLTVGISVDIMVLKKNKTEASTLFIDASEGVVKQPKVDILGEEHIAKIVATVAERKEEPHYARLVPNSEIGNKEHDYNLSVSQYVTPKDTREVIDPEQLKIQIAETVAEETRLRKEVDALLAEIGL